MRNSNLFRIVYPLLTSYIWLPDNNSVILQSGNYLCCTFHLTKKGMSCKNKLKQGTCILEERKREPEKEYMDLVGRTSKLSGRYNIGIFVNVRSCQHSRNITLNL